MRKPEEMSRDDLLAFQKLNEKKRDRCPQGSKNWRKYNARVNKATLNLRTISN